MLGLGARVVEAPDGVRWRVGRLWLGRPLPRWRKMTVGDRTGELASSVPFPDGGGPEDFVVYVAVLVGAVVFVFVLIPLLLFGIELVILGILLAAGILGRALLGRPWEVRATPAAGAPLAWKVRGIRRSARVSDEVAAALARGHAPAPVEEAEPVALDPGGAGVSGA